MPFQEHTAEDPDLVEAVVARHRLIRVYWLLMAAVPLSIMALVASLLTYTQIKANNVADERRAQEARTTIIRILKEVQSCTTPDGACAKRGAENGVSLSSAITYCTLNLPKQATRDQVTSCIVKELEGTP